MPFNAWAVRWGIPPEAMAELRAELFAPTEVGYTTPGGMLEAPVQQRIRLEAPKINVGLWRNNVGASPHMCPRCELPLSMVRYGLANESARMNKAVKSHDLIGVTAHLVLPSDVGRTLGIFTSVEVKREGWKYTGVGREPAQLAWANIVRGFGGRATFATSVDDLRSLK